MAKGTSSASKGTRKKNAAKAAARGNEDTTPAPARPKQRGQKADKPKRGVPKPYVEPAKAPRGEADPVDVFGLAQSSELVPIVTLRLLAKRDEKTLGRGLEELEAWLADATDESILIVLPVWVEHFARLAQHADRRIRSLVAAVQAKLIAGERTAVRDELLSARYLEQHASFVGAWACLAFDVDRSIQQVVAQPTWRSALDRTRSSSLDLDTYAPEIMHHVSMLLHPAAEGEADEQGDRARLYSAAASALSWLIGERPSPSDRYEALLGPDSSLWPLLDSSVESSPTVRSATWRLLDALVSAPSLSALLDLSLPSIAHPALYGALTESDRSTQSAMWKPLLALLAARPSTWSLADDTGDGSSDEESDSSQQPNGQHAAPPITSAFLSWIELGCRGPANMAAVVVLLSSSHQQVLPLTQANVDRLFLAFGNAFEGRAVTPTDLTAMIALASAQLDCAAYIAQHAERPIALASAASHLEQVIGLALLPPRLATTAERQIIELVAAALKRYEGKDSELFDATARSLESVSELALRPLDHMPTRATSVLVALASVRSAQTPLYNAAVDQAVGRVALGLARLDSESSPTRLDMLAALIRVDGTREAMFGDGQTATAIDHAVLELAGRPDLPPTSLAQAYLTRRGDSSRQADVWRQLAPRLRSTPLSSSLLSILVVDAVEGWLPAELPSLNLDDAVTDHLSQILGSEIAASDEQARTLGGLIERPSAFVADGTVEVLLSLVAHRFGDLASTILAGFPVDEIQLETTLRLIRGIRPATLVARPAAQPIVVALFELVHLVPSDDPAPSAAATQIYAGLSLSNEARQAVVTALRTRLDDPSSSALPADIARSADVLGLSPSTALDQLVGDEATMATLLDDAAPRPPSSVLAILDPLVALDSFDESSSRRSSRWLRRTLAGVRIVTADRQLGRSVDWFVGHAAIVSLVLGDRLALIDGVVDEADRKVPDMVAAVAAADTIVASSLSTAGGKLDAKWHEATIALVRSGTDVPASADGLQRLVVGLARRGRAVDSSYARRALVHVLVRLLRYSDTQQADAERWLALGSSLSPSSELGRALILAVRDDLFESPGLQRLQNELASNLSGVRPRELTVKAGPLLRQLVAVAPPLDAPYAFLPKQRAVFLLQAVTKWFADDDADEVADEVYVRLAELFAAIAPTLQDTPGAHWDLMFDVVDSNLEMASWSDPSSLPALYHALRLVQVVQSLCASNPILRSECGKRLDAALRSARDVLLVAPARPPSAPLRAVLDLLIDTTRMLSLDGVAIADTLPKLSDLLRGTEPSLQLVSFHLARRMIEAHVQEAVVAAELATESVDPAGLPEAILSAVVAVPSTRPTTGTLLTWLLVFDFFSSASFRLKTRYVEQLRQMDAIGAHFLPLVFAALELQSRAGPIDLSPWTIDRLEWDAVDLDPASVPVLAAHAYYRCLRAVPSLVRAWNEACLNKQLGGAVASLTARHVSPVLIEAELAAVRRADGVLGQASGGGDDDDGGSTMSVKVAPAVNEVRAVYTVDEQPMELTVRLPSVYPLQPVEIRDRRAAVPERQWRAWVLAVQQILGQHDGAIADALALFKRNLEAHFDGIEPCAICYSVIEAVDRALPTKTCATCRNRFHPGCLYKWFQSSHSSSCPLCRSLF